VKACRFGAVERRIRTAQNRFPAQTGPLALAYQLWVSMCKHLQGCRQRLHVRATCAGVSTRAFGEKVMPAPRMGRDSPVGVKISWAEWRSRYHGDGVL